MTEDIGFEGAPVDTGDNAGQDTGPVDSSGGHPAWDEALTTIPEPLRPGLKEHFKKWDDGVQQRFQQVHSQYEPYKPLIDQGLTAQQLEQAYGFYQAANSNPRAVWDKMAEFYGFGNEQGQNGQQQQEQDPDGFQVDDPYAPQIEQLTQQQESMRQFLAAQEAEKMQSQADSHLDGLVTSLTEKHGQFDEDYVMNRASAEFQRTGNFDKAVENAVLAYHNLVNTVRTAPRAGDNAPRIPSSSGGVPVAQNPANLSDSDRRAAGAAMIARMRG